jgi:hypothetical protein
MSGETELQNEIDVIFARYKDFLVEFQLSSITHKRF